jgi:PPOX class probable F420-dependent enzyme
MSSTLDAPKKAKTILLTTYKRDGAPVATPVSIAFDGDRAFFRSSDEAWKTKRLRNNPSVDVAPATLRGSRRVQPFMRGQRSWRAAKPSLRATR